MGLRDTPAPACTRPWRIIHSEASLGWGGEERRIWAELAGFRKRGHHVGILAPEQARIFSEAAQDAMTRERLSERKWIFPFDVLRAARFLTRFQADIVNTHSSRDGWIVGLAARWARTPLVIRSRHFDVPVRNPWLSQYVYRTLADHLITTSPKVADDFRRLFHLPPDRVDALPTGVDLARFSATGPKASFDFPTSERGPTVGIIGIIRRAKGHTFLFDALKQLADKGRAMNCVVVGEGPNQPAVEARARELRLRDRIRFLGTRDDVPEILRGLDVLAIPSLHEAIPQVGLQALAVGTPVVASRVGGLPSIIRENETGRLCPPGNATALAEMLQATFDRPEETRTFSAKGQQMVMREHTVEVMLDRLGRIYHRYLDGPLGR
ncbi:MAG: glycosyltransferase family 4 protein [Verrucomicrobia bacterium]|nr:glycosyltransferase family 4 protein [Verrucomicrobiota bacterium]